MSEKLPKILLIAGVVGRVAPTKAMLGVVALACALRAQQLLPAQPIQPGTVAKSENDSTAETESKRIFFIIPNYRTAPSFDDFKPLTSGQKFKVATADSFDRGTFVLAALFGGEGQLTNANSSFGQGATGFGKYFGASFGDFVIGNYMTEAAYPSLLHQDPRYFRRGTGTRWSRFGYAISQTFWTHGDSGKREFNYSELVGNSTAVAISNAYYSDNRTASNAVSKLSMQIGIDTASNILKEFWPDLEHKFRKKHHGDIETAQDELSSQMSRERQIASLPTCGNGSVSANQGLGKANSQLLNHWEKLTLFLKHPGVPIDNNNIVERALKKAILNRKNALFYKTLNGAAVGDLFMSLIHMCELNGANPFDYLTKLLRHAQELKQKPSEWMPWNYREASTCMLAA